MDLEAKSLAKALVDLKGKFDLEIIGIRACRLPKNLASRGASCIIMAGLCGALDPALKIGDIVTDETAFLRSQSSDLSPQCCPLHTAPQLIATPAEKARLFGETGCPAVDMENAIVRAAAVAAGIPFIGIRAISDRADQGIDPAVMTIVDEIGRPKALAVAGLLMRKPGLVGDLRRLQADSEIALKSLGRAVKDRLKAMH